MRTVSSTLQDYLETILSLDARKGAARVRDIAAELSVHKSTVSSTLKTLAEKGFVNYSPYELVTLTRRGRSVAEAVSKNHRIIKRFLTDVLLVDETRAGENACRMEHVIDDEVLDRLTQFAEFFEDEGTVARRLPERFATFVGKQSERTGPGKGRQAARSDAGGRSATP